MRQRSTLICITVVVLVCACTSRMAQLPESATAPAVAPSPAGARTPAPTLGVPIPQPLPSPHDKATASAVAEPALPSNLQANSWSLEPRISADGRFVAFASDASNLVPGDTNRATDVFVRDRLTGGTERVSINSEGMQGDSSSDAPAMSADGRYVVFSSYATNLVPDKHGGRRDIYVRDRLKGTTERVSVSSNGAQGNAESFSPNILADGRYVTFLSYASNLVPGGTSASAVYIHDRQTRVTQKASAGVDAASARAGCLADAVSPDGRWVAFAAWRDLTDLGPASDIYIRDRVVSETLRITLGVDGQASNGPSGSPSISRDGQWVAYMSEATNLAPGTPSGSTGLSAFLYERASSRTQWVARLGSSLDGGIIGARLLDLTPDGRWLAFGFGDISVYDRNSGKTECVSTAPGGAVARGGGAMEPSISADGRYVAFTSGAANLVPDDTNGVDDIFVHDRMTGETERVSVASR